MITRRKSGQVGGEPPAACWAIPGFQAEHDALFGESRQLADDLWGTPDAAAYGCTDDMTKKECTDIIFDTLRTNLMGKYGCENIGPGTPVAGAPCDSFENKYAVQVALRGMGLYADTIDGKWGKNSQAALDQSGMTFEQLAPGCTPPAPKYTGTSGGGSGTTPGGGGGGTTTPGGGEGTNVGAGEGSKSSNAWMWGVGAAVILGLGAAVVLTKKKQPYASNPVNYPYDQRIVEKVFGKYSGDTKQVRIRLSADTRLEWSTLVDVPANATKAQLKRLGELYDQEIEGGDYEENVDFFERRQPQVEVLG